MRHELIIADVRAGLASLPDESVHCVVTSPPYMGLREYGTDPQSWRDGWVGELGRETRLEDYIEHLAEVFKAVARVLRQDGTLWIVIGDTFGRQPGKTRGPQNHGKNVRVSVPREGMVGDNIMDGDRALVPARLAIRMAEDGWRLRSDIIWAKSGSFQPSWCGRCLPESVGSWAWVPHRIKARKAQRSRKQGYAAASGRRDHSHDYWPTTEWKLCPGCQECAPNDGLVLRRFRWRPTAAHEHVLMFARSDSYYGDREACAEPLAESSLIKRMSQPSFQMRLGGSKTGKNPNKNRDARKVVEHLRESGTATKNLRDVWLVPPGCSKMPHYATFPATIVNPIIMSSTPAGGVCRRCGAPSARMIRVVPTGDIVKITPDKIQKAQGRKWAEKWEPTEKRTIGWRKTCGCRSQLVPATVLDPFVGSGTTLECAAALGRSGVGIDLDPRSEHMVRDRLGLFAASLNVSAGKRRRRRR